MRHLTNYWPTKTLTTDLFDEMDRFFGESMRPVVSDKAFIPAFEISETDDMYHMSADLPGMKKEDIKIELVENVLTISGERKREAKTEDKNHKIQRLERSYGQFKRSFSLPSTVESGKVEAHYANGVLDLFLPKAKAAQARQIEIQTGKSNGTTQ